MTSVLWQAFTGKKVNPKKIWRIPSIDFKQVKVESKTDFGKFAEASKRLNLKRGRFTEISSKTRGRK